MDFEEDRFYEGVVYVVNEGLVYKWAEEKD